MKQKNKQKYDISRHHAWAASVLLAILIASRGFLELTDIKINDNIFVIIGFLLIAYALIAVFFTYKYRSSLNIEQKKIIEIHKEEPKTDLEKEKLKIEKKKLKNEAKKAKKTAKKQEK